MLDGKIVRQEDGHFDVCIKCPGAGQYCSVVRLYNRLPRLLGRGEESIDQLQCADIYISTYLDLDNCSQIYVDNPWPEAEKMVVTPELWRRLAINIAI